jgi:Vam6/Vps39-like protein vacuolar protein sorting-associated protein 39
MLLQFINSTHYYSVDRLYGFLSSEGDIGLTCADFDTHVISDLFEARAILLGRLGRHEHALELYVYRLQDYLKAEEYALQSPTHSDYSQVSQILQEHLSTGHTNK